jgi:peroxiredoxin
MRGRTQARRTAIFVTAGVAVLVVAVGTVMGIRSSAPTASASINSETVPAMSGDALARASDAVGFRQTTGPDVGVIEGLPADTALLPPSATLLAAGKAAPDFSLQTPTGSRVRLSDYKGRTVLLEFFATWCPHCQAEAAHLVTLAASLEKDKVAFLSVNADGEDAASIYAFERWFKIPWPSLVDPGSPAGSFRASGGAGAVTRAFGVALYPTFFVIDPQGRIVWRSDREQPDALLLQKLRNASGA